MKYFFGNFDHMKFKYLSSSIKYWIQLINFFDRISSEKIL